MRKAIWIIGLAVVLAGSIAAETYYCCGLPACPGSPNCPVEAK